jgi:hypothetical protein
MSTFNDSGFIDSSVKQRFGGILPTGYVFKDLFMRPLFGVGTVVFRKGCIDKVGYFDKNLPIGEDYDMWLRIARHFELGVVDQPLLMYRFHDTMATRGLGLKSCNGVPWEVVVLSKILELYPEALDELGQAAVKRRMSRPWGALGLSRFRLSDYKSARAKLRKAASYWPTNLGYWIWYAATFLHPTQIAAARKLYHHFSMSRSTHDAGASKATIG